MSNLQNNRIPKGKAKKKKGRRNISRQKLFSNLYQICYLGSGKPKFNYEHVTCVKDSQCLNRCLLDCTARKLRSPVLKILKVVTFKAKYCIPQYFRDKSALKNKIHRAKNAPKLANFHFCQKIKFSFSIHNSNRVWESRYCSLERSFRRFKV